MLSSTRIKKLIWHVRTNSFICSIWWCKNDLKSHMDIKDEGCLFTYLLLETIKKRPFAIISSNNDRYPLNALITKVTLLIIIQIFRLVFLINQWLSGDVITWTKRDNQNLVNTMWKVQYSLMRTNDRRRFPLLRNGQNNQSLSTAWKEKLFTLMFMIYAGITDSIDIILYVIITLSLLE